MKTCELFELRKSEIVQAKDQKKVYVKPGTRGAREEIDYYAGGGKGTGKWYKWVKVPAFNDDGTPKMRKTFLEPGFRELKSKTNTGRGAVLGTIGDWMEQMGATNDDIAPAREEVINSPEYKKLINLGFKDVTGEGEKKAGTISLQVAAPMKDWRGNIQDTKILRKVHINGNIRTFSFASGDKEVRTHNAGRGNTYHPMTIKTHPDLSPRERLVGSMRASLDVLLKMYRKPILKGALDKMQDQVNKR